MAYDIIKEILVTLVTIAVPIVTGLIVYGVRWLAAWLQAKAGTVALQSYIAEIADAVQTAVIYVNQTYVDGLKAAGTFDTAAMKTALNTALKTALDRISEAGKQYISETYGDIDTYLTAQIEAAVWEAKKGATDG